MQAQSTVFADTLRQRKMPVQFETIPGRGHFQLVQAIGSAGDPTTEIVTRFALGQGRAIGPAERVGEDRRLRLHATE